MQALKELLTGKMFTWIILALYFLRFVTYVAGESWGLALYWLCAIGITAAAEFLIARWP